MRESWVEACRKVLGELREARALAWRASPEDEDEDEDEGEGDVVSWREGDAHEQRERRVDEAREGGWPLTRDVLLRRLRRALRPRPREALA